MESVKISLIRDGIGILLRLYLNSLRFYPGHLRPLNVMVENFKDLSNQNKNFLCHERWQSSLKPPDQDQSSAKWVDIPTGALKLLNCSVELNLLLQFPPTMDDCHKSRSSIMRILWYGIEPATLLILLSGAFILTVCLRSLRTRCTRLTRHNNLAFIGVCCFRNPQQSQICLLLPTL